MSGKIKRNRDRLIKFYVSEKEMNLIHERMVMMKIKNLSAYLRKVAIDIHLFNVNTEDLEKELKKLNNQISKVGTNINQIVRKNNSNLSISKEEKEELLNCVKALTKLNEYKNKEVNDVVKLELMNYGDY